MRKALWECFGVVSLIFFVFVFIDTWRQVSETNRFIEQLLEAVKDRPQEGAR